MNYAVYIAAAAVMAVLIGLVVLSILWLEKKVLRGIRSKTIGLLSVYDQLLEEKSQALAQLEARQAPSQEEAPAPAPGEDSTQALKSLGAAILSTAERSGNVAYREESAGALYRTIRENFSYELDQVLEVLQAAVPKKQGPATRLLEKLDYDIVYQLSTMTPEDQRSILESVLDDQEREILTGYAGSTRRFSAVEFYDRLQSLAAQEPGPARLMVAEDVAAHYTQSGDIAVLADPEICEGYQVEQDNRLYDFSIKTRELS